MKTYFYGFMLAWTILMRSSAEIAFEAFDQDYAASTTLSATGSECDISPRIYPPRDDDCATCKENANNFRCPHGLFCFLEDDFMEHEDKCRIDEYTASRSGCQRCFASLDLINSTCPCCYKDAVTCFSYLIPDVTDVDELRTCVKDKTYCHDYYGNSYFSQQEIDTLQNRLIDENKKEVEELRKKLEEVTKQLANMPAGQPGQKGIRGFPGSKGPKGDSGDACAEGPSEAVDQQGSTEPPGPPGPKGEPGPVSYLIQKHDFTMERYEDPFRSSRWQQYKDGFGDKNGRAYWMGLDELHRLTSSGYWRLIIKLKWDELQDGSDDERSGTWGVGKWTNFRVGAEADGYRLTIGRRIEAENMSGFDPFSEHPLDGKNFTTFDRDDDTFREGNCARFNGGGWWFQNCAYVCLNCGRSRYSSVYLWYDGVHRYPAKSKMYVEREKKIDD